MTGKPENDRCPLCGGRLKPGLATVPFLLPNATVLIKNVPAIICSSCHEPYTTGKVTDRIIDLLNSLRGLQAEVLVLPYPELKSAPTLMPVMEAHAWPVT